MIRQFITTAFILCLLVAANAVGQKHDLKAPKDAIYSHPRKFLAVQSASGFAVLPVRMPFELSVKLKSARLLTGQTVENKKRMN